MSKLYAGLIVIVSMLALSSLGFLGLVLITHLIDLAAALSGMTVALIIFAALVIVACAILAAIYYIVRDAPSQPQRQSYRRHRLWNFK